MTSVMPQDKTRSEAFSLRILKNIWGFKNPCLRKITAQAYIVKNTAMVMIRRRFVSVKEERFLSLFSPKTLELTDISVCLLSDFRLSGSKVLVPYVCDPLADDRSRDEDQEDNYNCFVSRDLA